MEEQYEGPLPRRRRRKKLRIGRVILTLLILFLLIASCYSYLQFNAGQSLAKGQEIDPGPFKGDIADPKNPSVENFLLLGIDDDGSGRSRTDTMMVLSWDKKEGKMRLISFMRDIYAEIPGYKSYKLNTAYYLGGVQTAKDTITGMFDLPIHHYAIIDFDNFESIIDTAFPDGIEMDVEKEMSEKIGVTLTPGTHQLNGKELLGYARFRADAEGDFGRVARQQKVISAVKEEAMRPGMLLHVPKLAGSVSGFIQTDLSTKDELTRALTVLMNRGAKIDTMTVPVEGSYSFNSYAHAGSVIELDLQKNKDAIAEFLQQ
ncbi:LytR family transcriptional regulator [Sporosarcina sp. NCCP-2222]|uniref:LCP family protein n=1 Tax=Sporosarcina sp. NCCP-2222 TaxID=2935073 RepID=UPI00208434A5|nr:LCP family protein [Sporosarcina sp. NCCP-2222]GKV57507.1 LytR family transcriptional regulator [Sporosarcina sp. NCCP-2222]